MTSPLRYPGGKSKACKILEKILIEHYDVKKFNTLVSPFFGGGSFEFYLNNKYKLNIIANDKFTPLYTFWSICQTNKDELCNELYHYLNCTKEQFLETRSDIMNQTGLSQAISYFIINRCSFNGSTLSGGFSLEASKKRFTVSSIERIKQLNLNQFTFYNIDYKEILNHNGLIFLDPPYYISSKLYGNNGDMHENFDHEQLYQCLSQKTNWIMTYNDCDYIKNLYKKFKMIETSWSYGMNKTKKSSEIVIVGIKL